VNKVQNFVIEKTVPIEWALRSDATIWNQFYVELFEFIDLVSRQSDLFEWHRNVLGDFSTCFKVWNSMRYVWQWDNGCMLFVGSEWGPQFEVPKDTIPHEALMWWREYRDFMTSG